MRRQHGSWGVLTTAATIALQLCGCAAGPPFPSTDVEEDVATGEGALSAGAGEARLRNRGSAECLQFSPGSSEVLMQPCALGVVPEQAWIVMQDDEAAPRGQSRKCRNGARSEAAILVRAAAETDGDVPMCLSVRGRPLNGSLLGAGACPPVMDCRARSGQQWSLEGPADGPVRLQSMSRDADEPLYLQATSGAGALLRPWSDEAWQQWDVLPLDAP